MYTPTNPQNREYEIGLRYPVIFAGRDHDVSQEKRDEKGERTTGGEGEISASTKSAMKDEGSRTGAMGVLSSKRQRRRSRHSGWKINEQNFAKLWHN